MVLCPACGAENPDGTKICVKCATELPKSAPPGSAEAKKMAAGAPAGGSLWEHAKAMPQDMMDVFWLVVIILLVALGFWMEATDWKFFPSGLDDAKVVEEAPLPASIEKALPEPVKEIVHRPMPKPKPKPAIAKPAPKPALPPPAPPLEVAKKPAVVPTPVAVVTVKPTPKPVQAAAVVAVAPAPKPAAKATPRPVLGEKPAAGIASSPSLYNQSKTQFDARQYETSFKLLKQALQVDPTYAKAYFGLGYLYNKFDMEDASVRMYEMSLRFDPKMASSMNNLGMIYYNAGNYEDAVYALRKAVDLDPRQADYPFNMANALMETGKALEALPYFQKAVEIKPREALYHNDLALCYEKLGRAAEAEAAWKKVAELTNDPALFDQAQTHLEYIKKVSAGSPG